MSIVTNLEFLRATAAIAASGAEQADSIGDDGWARTLRNDASVAEAMMRDAERERRVQESCAPRA